MLKFFISHGNRISGKEKLTLLGIFLLGSLFAPISVFFVYTYCMKRKNHKRLGWVYKGIMITTWLMVFFYLFQLILITILFVKIRVN